MASFETIQTNSIVYHTLITFISFTVLFGGIFGNTANILVLTRLKLFRNNSATFYLVTESIVNVFQMLIPFTSRIAINSFDSDLTKTSLVWCKFRQVFSQIVALMTLSIICFASFDQFLSTSHYPYLRQSSTVRLARITVSSAALLSFIQAIPFVIYFEIRPLLGCSVYDAGIVIYTTYGYYFLLSGILPIFISSLFSILAYQNVRRIVRRQMAIRRRKLDQQLTAMILARVTFFILTFTPYVVVRIYILVSMKTQPSVTNTALVQIVSNISTLLSFVNYSVDIHCSK